MSNRVWPFVTAATPKFPSIESTAIDLCTASQEWSNTSNGKFINYVGDSISLTCLFSMSTSGIFFHPIYLMLNQ